ncbi:hypothetical protein JL100_029960 (plasmid) [Skermanella mucosa]|uniref:hypothetical protein n=1 Tax=Skermanella mucosa TaxID=1789672 RepID=UPI00192A98C7|nr:hypothetical protein [Skermanella mucosa]UEM24467.1 hypothetical protein JL100_029960 [Skermanella mucosa]
MHITSSLSRRAFCSVAAASTAAVSTVAAAGFAPPTLSTAVPAGGDEFIFAACARYREMTEIIAAHQGRIAAAYEQAIPVIGEFPESDLAARSAWQERYQSTDAWALELELDDICEEYGEVLGTIVDAHPVTLAGLLAKMQIYQETRDDVGYEDEFLDIILEDL